MKNNIAIQLYKECSNTHYKETTKSHRANQQLNSTFEEQTLVQKAKKAKKSTDGTRPKCH